MLGRSGRALLAALLVCAGASASGQTSGIVTLAEGGVVIVRGTTTYAAAPGVAVRNGDMLAADPKGQAQIEFDDGAILNLARGARAFLLATQGEPGVALESGWAKFTRAKAAKGKPYRYIAPLARLSTAGATAVMRVGADACEYFIETGTANLVELSKSGSAGSGRDVRGGDFIVRREGQPLAVSPRPSADFVKAMPTYFRDDLAAFLPRVRDRDAEPRREHEARYDEVDVWLKASLPVRRGLMERFQSRAKDAAFRAKLIENLASHPEWDRVLFPEKHLKDEQHEKAEKEKTQ